MENNVALIRVSNNTVINAIGFNLSLDVDSWTWSFGAEIPPWYFDAIQRTSPEIPVELQASVNGFNVRIIVESITRDRTFGSKMLRISGRGLNALLDTPYAPMQNFTNDAERTIQQIAEDVLLFNNVPFGWDVQWNPIAWTIPSGIWSHQGNYASAMNALATSAGAYVQPNPVAKTLKVLSLYPVMPRDWDEVSPDIVLPSATVTVEGITWQSKPKYNRIFIEGQQGGVSVEATLSGTDGTFLAPQVVEPLMTTVEGARARAEAEFSKGGDYAMVRLRLPIHPEFGAIVPGKFVRYTDGSEIRLGLVRSLSMEANQEESWQTIEVETRA